MTTIRWRVVLLATMAMAIAAGVALVYTFSPTDRGGPSSSLPLTTGAASGAASTMATPRGPTETGTSPAGRTTTRAAGTGPGLTELGVHVVAQADANGDLEVVEQILLARPVSTIGLTPPTAPAYPGLEGVAPQVVDLQAESRGVPVAVSLSNPLVRREELRLGPTTALSLRYRLGKASRRTEPSTLGRALVVLPAISVGDFPDLPVVIEVVGPGIRNVLCLRLVGDKRFCAVQVGQSWATADLTGRPLVVIAQLDLPAPG